MKKITAKRVDIVHFVNYVSLLVIVALSEILYLTALLHLPQTPHIFLYDHIRPVSSLVKDNLL